MKAIVSVLLLTLFATAIHGQTFECTITNFYTGSCALTGLTGFAVYIPWSIPFWYGTFYYSGVGPYHEYDAYLDQNYLPLYEDLTSSMHFEEYGLAT